MAYHGSAPTINRSSMVGTAMRLEPSGAIWSRLEPSGAIWSHLGPSGAIWSHVDYLGLS